MVSGKNLSPVGCPVQCCCIAPCAFEYVGGVVVYSGHSMGSTIQNSDIIFSSLYGDKNPHQLLIRGGIFFKIQLLSDTGFLHDSPNGHRFSDD
uniref:Uncharacterized protein n=1 Tax=Equus caballus TaxID=9796 RepID=A0A9L0SP67_HORSE